MAHPNPCTFRLDAESKRNLRIVTEATAGNQSEAIRRALAQAAERLQERNQAA